MLNIGINKKQQPEEPKEQIDQELIQSINHYYAASNQQATLPIKLYGQSININNSNNVSLPSVQHTTGQSTNQ